MHQTESIDPRLNRIQLGAVIFGALGLIVSLVGAVLDPGQFFQGYYVAFLFWGGISMGALGLLMVINMLPGTVGFSIQRVLAAGARTMPLVALLFIPLLFGMQHVFPWTLPEVRAELPASKAFFFTVPFFLIRAVIYFVVWIFLAYAISRWSYQHDESEDGRLIRNMQRLSYGGIILFVVLATFAAMDWSMSISPKWWSSVYGLIVIARDGLGAMVFTVMVMGLIWRGLKFSAEVGQRVVDDLSSMTLASLMLWGYLEFFQLLIIYQGNLPGKSSWYVERIQGGWDGFITLIAIFHFIVPLIFLLVPGFRRSIDRLVAIAALIFIMRYFYLLWMAKPVFVETISFNMMDLIPWLGFGGIWVAAFIWLLKQHRLLPVWRPQKHKATGNQSEDAYKTADLVT